MESARKSAVDVKHSDQAGVHASAVGRELLSESSPLTFVCAPQGSAFPNTLGELVGRLKAWRATLQATVENATPAPLRLETLSRKLQVQTNM